MRRLFPAHPLPKIGDVRHVVPAVPSVQRRVLIQSNQAINIIPNVRVFQNDRNAEAGGTVIPVDIGATTTGLTDMVADVARQRLYIANPALNRLEVFDMQKRQFLAPITVGQLPKTMAFGADGNTLYVAGSGGENIGIVDLTLGKLTGRVRFPAIPLRSGLAQTAQHRPYRESLGRRGCAN